MKTSKLFLMFICIFLLSASFISSIGSSETYFNLVALGYFPEYDNVAFVDDDFSQVAYFTDWNQKNAYNNMEHSIISTDGYMYGVAGRVGSQASSLFRINLGTMKIESSLELPAVAYGATCVLEVGNYLYVGCATAPKGTVWKVQRNPLSLVTYVETDAQKVRDIETNGTHIFAIHDSVKKVSRIRISDFSYVDEAAMDTYIGYTIEKIGDYLYFTDAAHVNGNISKFQMSTFTHVDTITFNVATNGIASDQDDSLFVGIEGNPAKLCHINATTFTTIANLTLESGVNTIPSLIVDSNKLYAGMGSTERIHRISLPGFTIDTNLTFSSNIQKPVTDMVFDSASLYAIATPSGYPIITKIEKNTFTEQVYDTLCLQQQEQHAGDSLTYYDGYFYVAVETPLVTVVKINAETFERVSYAILIPANGSYAYCMVGWQNYLFCGIDEGIARIDLSDFKQDASIKLSGSLIIDMQIIGSSLYAVDYNTDTVYKINPTSMIELDSLTPSSATSLMAIEHDTNYLYVGTCATPAKIARIYLGNFTEASTLTLTTGPINTIEIVQSYLYAGLYSDPAKIIRVDLTTFTEKDSLTFAAPATKILTIISTDYDTLYVLSSHANEYSYLSKVDISTFTRTQNITLNIGASWTACCLAASDLYTVIIPPSFLNMLRSNFYLVFALVGIMPLAFGALLIIGIVKSKETLEPRDITALIAVVVSIIVAFIIVYSFMSATIGG